MDPAELHHVPRSRIDGDATAVVLSRAPHVENSPDTEFFTLIVLLADIMPERLARLFARFVSGRPRAWLGPKNHMAGTRQISGEINAVAISSLWPSETRQLLIR